MLPRPPGGVIRTARGGTGALRPWGTHQLRQSTPSVVVSPAGSASSAASGGTTAGNAGGSAGTSTCRCCGAGAAPTSRTSGRPVSRQAPGPALRKVTRPVPPATAGWNRKPVPTTRSRAARHGLAGTTCPARSCGGTEPSHGTSGTLLAGSRCAAEQPASKATTAQISASGAPPHPGRVMTAPVRRQHASVVRASWRPPRSSCCRDGSSGSPPAG